MMLTKNYNQKKKREDDRLLRRMLWQLDMSSPTHLCHVKSQMIFLHHLKYLALPPTPLQQPQNKCLVLQRLCHPSSLAQHYLLQSSSICPSSFLPKYHQFPQMSTTRWGFYNLFTQLYYPDTNNSMIAYPI